ncbi:MAG: hypothetical protein Q9165_008836 [Trypethelium subeluteriae]
MEETNFQRPANNIEVTDNVAFEGKTPNEFSTIEASSGTPPGGFISKGQKSKSYLQKLRVFEKEQLKKPNELKGMILRPLIFLTFPVELLSGKSTSFGKQLLFECFCDLLENQVMVYRSAWRLAQSPHGSPK